jgi:hypothetical protein
LRIRKRHILVDAIEDKSPDINSEVQPVKNSRKQAEAKTALRLPSTKTWERRYSQLRCLISLLLVNSKKNVPSLGTEVLVEQPDFIWRKIDFSNPIFWR